MIYVFKHIILASYSLTFDPFLWMFNETAKWFIFVCVCVCDY